MRERLGLTLRSFAAFRRLRMTDFLGGEGTAELARKQDEYGSHRADMGRSGLRPYKIETVSTRLVVAEG